MTVVLIILHVLVCFALILIVLLQTGKGADIGAVFGSGGSQTLFGPTGATTFLSKATTIAAVVFMLTSFSLAYIASRRPATSVVTPAPAAVETRAPEAPAPPAGEARPAAPEAKTP
ncbi:MAG: preprotein translocase subunit SecG [Desulfobacterales bacterium]